MYWYYLKVPLKIGGDFFASPYSNPLALANRWGGAFTKEAIQHDLPCNNFYLTNNLRA
jgi:hypothetical protein